jgi:tetratricopeptide (TPR) repeat protein
MSLAPTFNELVAPTGTESVVPGAVVSGTHDVVWLTNPEDVSGIVLQARDLAERYPRSPAVLARLAHAELQAGGKEEALDSARRSLDSQVEDIDMPAFVAAVQVLLALGERDEAEEAMERGPLWHPAVAALYIQVARDPAKMRRVLDELGDRSSAISRAVLGWVHIRFGEYAAAIHELRISLAESPDPASFINLGYAYAALGSHAKAIRATQSALKLSEVNRTASFNLTAYYVATDELTKATAEMQRLRQFYPDELNIAFALASISLEQGDARAALDLLRRARTSRAARIATPMEQAELSSNIAFLEFRLGTKDRKATARHIHRQLVATSHGSIGIARLLSRMLTRHSEASLLEAVYEALRRVHQPETLYDIEARLAMLRGDYDHAIDAATSWWACDPFSQQAPTLVTYLYSEVRGDYEKTVEVGIDALKRFPKASVLANNVSFALAMLGRVSEARAFLPKASSATCVRATAGFIELMAGRTDLGLSLYRDAAKLAEERGDREGAALVRYRLRLLTALEEGVEAGDLPQPEAEYQDDPSFEFIRDSTRDIWDRTRAGLGAH